MPVRTKLQEKIAESNRYRRGSELKALLNWEAGSYSFSTLDELDGYRKLVKSDSMIFHRNFSGERVVKALDQLEASCETWFNDQLVFLILPFSDDTGFIKTTSELVCNSLRSLLKYELVIISTSDKSLGLLIDQEGSEIDIEIWGVDTSILEEEFAY